MSSISANSLLTKNVRSRPGTTETSFGNSSSWKMYAIEFSLMRPISHACNFSIGRGRDRRANLSLHMALDGRLRRPSPFFTPNKRDFRARLTVFDIDYSQRDHCTLVERVARISGYADCFAALQYLVVRQR